MDNHVLVAMGRSEESENALEYAIEEFSNATISVIHVMVTSDPLGLFGNRNPETYTIPDCDFELDNELLPDPDSFSRAQR